MPHSVVKEVNFLGKEVPGEDAVTVHHQQLTMSLVHGKHLVSDELRQ